MYCVLFVSIGSVVSDNSFMYRQIYTSILCVYSSDTRVLGSIANFSRPPDGQSLASTEHARSCQNVPGVCVEHEATNKSMAWRYEMSTGERGMGRCLHLLVGFCWILMLTLAFFTRNGRRVWKTVGFVDNLKLSGQNKKQTHSKKSMNVYNFFVSLLKKHGAIYLTCFWNAWTVTTSRITCFSYLTRRQNCLVFPRI